MNGIEHGPYPIAISNGLDFYKPTMSQLAFEQMLETRVTFTFKNRGDQKIVDFLDPIALQQRLTAIKQNGFSQEELDYLRQLRILDGSKMFTNDYLDYLDNNELPEVNIGISEESKDIFINTTGTWPLVTFWETVVMSEVNEAYFEGYMLANNINPFDIYEEGDRRLSEKIAVLKNNPGIKFSDFGTRRHFSYRWQKHVIQRIIDECPDNFIGTSNIGLANSLRIQPIGTFAHEMPMVYAAVADQKNEHIIDSHGRMLDDWYKRYGKKLAIALTDTFSTDFFFQDFGNIRAEHWSGLRHDSGDPIEFGEKAIRFYEKNGIEPKAKTIVFSDGLDIETIEKLYNHFKDRIGVVFGWGTTLTNDLGIEPLNIVMKATSADSVNTVKLSDSRGKHTGTEKDIERYKHVFCRNNQ
jgi:nicotinate phosphoribosyltransferase